MVFCLRSHFRLIAYSPCFLEKNLPFAKHLLVGKFSLKQGKYA